MLPFLLKSGHVLAPLVAANAQPSALKAGDVVGFSGTGWLSGIINLGTYGIPWWSVSHVGILAHASDGRLLLFESTSLEDWPCEIYGEKFSGSQAHSFDKVLSTYHGKIWHYPLYRPLYDNEDRRLTEFLMGSLHTPYDMMGAFRSGGVGLSWVESCFRECDLRAIFCSEWVAAALSYIGIFHTDNASRWNPTRLCRRLRWKELVLKPKRLK